MSTNTTNNRLRITIDTKVAMINAVAKQEKSNAQECRDFEIISSTFYTIFKDNDKILNAHDSGDFTGEMKKIRGPDFYQVDESLLLFFKQATTQDIPIGGLRLLEKGNQCYFPFTKTQHSSLFSIMGITTTLAITTL